jgi:hypothetical protein
MMNVEEQKKQSSNGKLKVLVLFYLSYFVNLVYFLLQNFRKRVFHPFTSRCVTNKNDEQQTSLLHEQNKKTEAPIQNEDFQV